MEEIKKLMSVVENSTDQLLASLPGYEYVSKIAKDSNKDILCLLKAALLDRIEADLYISTDDYAYHVLYYSYVNEHWVVDKVRKTGSSEWKDNISSHTLQMAERITKEDYLKFVETQNSKRK